MFYSGKEKANLCTGNKMDELKLPSECIFVGHYNMHCTGVG